MAKEKRVLYRAAKFPIYPTPKQEELLTHISENLRLLWNEALTERLAALDDYRKQKVQQKTLVQQAVACLVGEKSNESIKMPTLFDQINALTKKREDANFGAVPRNWQEETLDRLDGSFKSFFTLIKNGDHDARQPSKREKNFFQVIPGRSGFKVTKGFIEFAPNTFGKEVLHFPVPRYSQVLIASGIPKKFVIARDVADLSKKSNWSISVVYEIVQPKALPKEADKVVYLALGASSIGILSGPDDDAVERVMPFWRPDKHWKVVVNSIEDRIKKSNLVKGGLKWGHLMAARKKAFNYMRKQQRQNHREMVAKLLEIGKHFVVTDYVVRSKAGKLADARDTDRGGHTGLNFAAQNTGSFLDFVMHLEEKVKEVGGSVIKHRLKNQPPRGIGVGHLNKVAMAHHLKKEVLL